MDAASGANPRTFSASRRFISDIEALWVHISVAVASHSNQDGADAA
jgi:hypothetical protein